MTSSIYNGTVIHKRFKPKIHYFKYKVFSLLIDLSELSILDKNISFFSYNKFNLVSFFDKDHGERDGTSLVDWVKKNLNDNKIDNENIANKTEVKTGLRSNKNIEIVSGLTEGDIIVAEGLKKVRPRGKIKPLDK